MTPFGQAEAEAVVAHALERPVAEVFSSFGPPVAAASIAQVHRATMQRWPHRRGEGACGPASKRASRPISTRSISQRAPPKIIRTEARRLRLIEVVDTLARSVKVEMDLRLEAAALSEMAENTKDDTDFRVPAVDWNYTAKDVLTLEWIDGTPLSDRAALTAKGYDLPQLGRIVIQSFLRHAMRDGFFHADMHPGNLFVDAEGTPRRGRFRHHGPARRQGTALPRRDSARLHHPRLPAYRGSPFRGRLCAAASLGRGLRAGDPRHRRTDPFARRPTKSRWPSC